MTRGRTRSMLKVEGLALLAAVGVFGLSTTAAGQAAGGGRGSHPRSRDDDSADCHNSAVRFGVRARVCRDSRRPEHQSARRHSACMRRSGGAVGVDLFITNDDRLSRKHVTDVKFVTSLDRAYL